MKINNEIEINSFVTIECPFCYNVREIENIDDFRMDNNWRINIYCDYCHNSMYLEMSVSKYNINNLGLDSGNLRVSESD
jgi:hypothetical protein